MAKKQFICRRCGSNEVTLNSKRRQTNCHSCGDASTFNLKHIGLWAFATLTEIPEVKVEEQIEVPAEKEIEEPEIEEPLEVSSEEDEELEDEDSEEDE